MPKRTGGLQQSLLIGVLKLYKAPQGHPLFQLPSYTQKNVSGLAGTFLGCSRFMVISKENDLEACITRGFFTLAR